MALFTQLAKFAALTADTATSVPAGEVWSVYSINIQQPSTGLAKNVLVATGGTSLTAANVVQRYAVGAGQQNQTQYPGLGIPAGGSLNISADADTGVAIVTINGFKQKTV